MTKTYQFQTNETPVITETNKFLNWLPAIAWLPFALVINSIIIPPIISFGYWGRWIGLFLLTVFGFWQLFLSGKWQQNKFDQYAIPVLILITISTVFADSDSVLYASKFYETGVFKAFSILLTYLSLTWGLQSILHNGDSPTLQKYQAMETLRDSPSPIGEAAPTETLASGNAKSIRERAKAIVNNLLLVATLIYTVGLFGNLLKIIPQSLGAYCGIFFNPNTTAALGIVILPLSIWFASQNKQLGIFKFFPTFVIFVAIVLSEARTPLFAVGILIIYHFICCWKYKGGEIIVIYGMFAIIISLILILSIDFLGSPLFAQLYESLTNPNGAGITSFRTNLLWPLFIQEIFASPVSALIGHGWGSEEAFLKLQGMENNFFERWSLGSAHSAYVGLTYQIGILGSLLTFIPLWSLVVSNINKSSLVKNKEEFEFRLALTSTLLAELCVCFFETGFYNIGSAHALPVWLVTYIAATINARQET
jgi:uncharacterized membrane protein